MDTGGGCHLTDLSPENQKDVTDGLRTMGRSCLDLPTRAACWRSGGSHLTASSINKKKKIADRLRTKGKSRSGLVDCVAYGLVGMSTW